MGFDEHWFCGRATNSVDNGQAYIADTNPTNAASYFRFTAISTLPPMTVCFQSSSNRWYTMDGCSNIASGGWSNVPGAGPRVGAGGTDWMADTNAPARGPFYRLEVELP